MIGLNHTLRPHVHRWDELKASRISELFKSHLAISSVEVGHACFAFRVQGGVLVKLLLAEYLLVLVINSGVGAAFIVLTHFANFAAVDGA